MKSLIRRGHDGHALVRITLLNDDSSSDAFRHSDYGGRVVVERTIRRDGTSTYTLKDAAGRPVSRLKRDVDAMIDHLNIQVRSMAYMSMG